MFGSSLKIYTVHVNNKKSQPIENAEFVREGFSLWAFLFHLFWLMYYRAWVAAGVVFAFFAIMGALEQQGIIPILYSTVIQLGFQCYVGLTGQDWRRKALDDRGYSYVGVVSARDDIEAHQRFFDRYTRSSKTGQIYENEADMEIISA